MAPRAPADCFPGMRRSLSAALPGLLLLLLLFLQQPRLVRSDEAESCELLRLGQYRCNEPKIDEKTQEAENCREGAAWVDCLPAPNVTCRLANGSEFRFSGDEVGFSKRVACRNVSSYSYRLAVALSLFLGWLGADRFYLGYPALGVLKFCTVGFCGVGTLVDFVLVAMQIVGPSDGSSYIIDHYGARLTRLAVDNQTYRKPHPPL
ncbi:TM2 domain-containing protein 1 [Salarias fasciatus]|uniref:TM2 domain-containing protein n=1 Tax=Salarias fasciatus TaxID=181472 RepID=A0A672HNN6_SALFA|nr:TM2 domain-containing protein 1 [Salarias fasciatus]